MDVSGAQGAWFREAVRVYWCAANAGEPLSLAGEALLLVASKVVVTVSSAAALVMLCRTYASGAVEKRLWHLAPLVWERCLGLVVVS